MTPVTVNIPQSAGQCASGVIALPAGTACARVEAILSDADFAAPKTITGSVDVIVAGETVATEQFQVNTGSRGNGSAPVAQLNAAQPFAVDSVQVTLSCDDPACQVGAVITFADVPSNLPATQRPISGKGG